MSAPVSETGLRAFGDLWVALLPKERHAVALVAGITYGESASYATTAWGELSVNAQRSIAAAFARIIDIAGAADAAFDKARQAQFIG